MFDATERSVPLQGAQRLLLAVLEEAIGTFQRCAMAPDQRSRTMFKQADEWFDSEETGWIFAFESVCDALGVDPAHVRTGLRRWMDGQRVPFGEELPGRACGSRHDGRSAPPPYGPRAGVRMARAIPPESW